jgi:hypothetical protein
LASTLPLSGEAGKHAHEVKLQEIASMTIHNRLTRTLGIKHPTRRDRVHHPIPKILPTRIRR